MSKADASLREPPVELGIRSGNPHTFSTGLERLFVYCSRLALVTCLGVTLACAGKHSATGEEWLPVTGAPGTVTSSVRAREGRLGRIRAGLEVRGDIATLVLLADLNGNANTLSGEAVRDAVFGEEDSANAFIQEGSRGLVRLVGVEDPSGDVFGPFPLSLSGCPEGDYAALGDRLQTAARAGGVDVAAYDRIIHYLPRGASDCPEGAAGAGHRVFVFGVEGERTWELVAHELGHTFGLPHAARYMDCVAGAGTPDDPLWLREPCDHDERGDPTDVMGLRRFQFSSFHLEHLGWLAAENVLVLERSARVWLRPMELLASGVQSLRVPRRNARPEDAFLHLEYRQPLGVDHDLEVALTDGVLVRLVSDPETLAAPHLLDMRPSSFEDDMLDAALGRGSVFVDGPVQLRVVELTAEWALVEVVIDGIAPEPSTIGTENNLAPMPSPRDNDAAARVMRGDTATPRSLERDAGDSTRQAKTGACSLGRNVFGAPQRSATLGMWIGCVVAVLSSRRRRRRSRTRSSVIAVRPPRPTTTQARASHGNPADGS